MTGIEIERKYIIEMPSLELLRAESEYTESRIIQIYLDSEKGLTHRIRSRSYSQKTVYTETKKTRIDSMSVIEEEREISEEEFKTLSLGIKKNTAPIVKTRHTFVKEGITFEIDVYEKWSSIAIMETELESREEGIDIPSFIRIVKEVTGDFKYSNASLAVNFPSESEI